MVNTPFRARTTKGPCRGRTSTLWHASPLNGRVAFRKWRNSILSRMSTLGVSRRRFSKKDSGNAPNPCVVDLEAQTEMKALTSQSLAIICALMLTGCAPEEITPGDKGGLTPQGMPAATKDATAHAAEESAVFRVRYTGRSNLPTDNLRDNALKAAADVTRTNGHTHFAIIEEGTETVTGSGPVSSVGTTIPVVRSRRAGGRSRTGGGSTSIELGRPTAPAYFIRMIPFSDDPPPGAIQTYAVDAFP